MYTVWQTLAGGRRGALANRCGEIRAAGKGAARRFHVKAAAGTRRLPAAPVILLGWRFSRTQPDHNRDLRKTMLYLVMALLFVVPLWKICVRAGLPPWYALISAIPLVGPAIVIGILAFRPWRPFGPAGSANGEGK